MTEEESVAAQPLDAGDPTVTPWAEARERLAEGDWYWLATARPDGLPHVVPLLAVWLDDALHFVANKTTRKARNLAHEPHCVVAVAAEDAHLVVGGWPPGCITRRSSGGWPPRTHPSTGGTSPCAAPPSTPRTARRPPGRRPTRCTR